MTLTIGLLSDVHAHRPDQAEALAGLIEHINAQPAPDLLLLAGDVSHRTAELSSFLGALRADCPRCWVPGNHDVWVIDPESADDSAELRYRQRFAAISEAQGWHYLPAGPLLLPELGLAAVGTLGWFTGPGFSEWFDQPSSEQDLELARRLADELEAPDRRRPAGLSADRRDPPPAPRRRPDPRPTAGQPAQPLPAAGPAAPPGPASIWWFTGTGTSAMTRRRWRGCALWRTPSATRASTQRPETATRWSRLQVVQVNRPTRVSFVEVTRFRAAAAAPAACSVWACCAS